MKRLRILHAPAIITHQQWTISRAQRELGYKSDFMVFNADHDWQPQHDCDINFHFDRNMITFNPLRPIGLFKTAKFLIQFSMFFIKSLFKYDVFHFHSESFLGSRSTLDLKILRLFRKKIVFQYWGCDIRLKSMSKLENKYSTCDNCIRICQNSRKLRDILNHLKYADFRVYAGADTIKSVPDALFIPIAIDLTHCSPVWEIPEEYLLGKKDNSIRILQAFQNWEIRGDQKGTRFIRSAIEQLNNQGYKIEYIFLDKVPNIAMKYYYQQADIVIDALLTGWYSNVSVEAMAMGKPVVCYLNEEYKRLIPGETPIVNANPDNLVEVLRKLVSDKELREDIGRKGREYVEEFYDSIKIAQQYIDLYHKKWR